MPPLLTDKPSNDQPASVPAGPDQGIIEEARRRQRSRWLRVSLAMCLVLAGIGALIAVTTGGKPPAEAPLHLPPEPTLPPAVHPGSGSQSPIVRLSPNLEGGQAGWCVTVLETGGASGSCGPLPTFNHPLLYSSFGWTHGEKYIMTTEIVAPRVAYFLVNGTRRLATKPLPGVPYGLRIATLHTPLRGSPDRRRFATRPATLVPFDSQGKRIVESPDHSTRMESASVT